MTDRLYGSIHSGAKLLDEKEVDNLEAMQTEVSEDQESVDKKKKMRKAKG